MSAHSIAIESPLQSDVPELFAALDEFSATLTPPEYLYCMEPEEMASPRTSLFVARVEGKAVACGALHRHDKGVAEVKRMYTRPAFQGLGLAREIIEKIVALAEEEGFREIVLETGENYAPARRFYERAGFQQCGPVLDYPDSPYTSFYKMRLEKNTET